MATTITHSAGTFSPFLNGYEAESEARNVVHPILNRSDPDVTYRAAGLRTGTFTILIGEQADAFAAYDILRLPQTFAISDPDVPALSMSFVIPEGTKIGIALDPETQAAWIITVPFAEVLP